MSPILGHRILRYSVSLARSVPVILKIPRSLCVPSVSLARSVLCVPSDSDSHFVNVHYIKFTLHRVIPGLAELPSESESGCCRLLLQLIKLMLCRWVAVACRCQCLSRDDSRDRRGSPAWASPWGSSGSPRGRPAAAVSLAGLAAVVGCRLRTSG